jgi:hypothetical protein
MMVAHYSLPRVISIENQFRVHPGLHTAAGIYRLCASDTSCQQVAGVGGFGNSKLGG